MLFSLLFFNRFKEGRESENRLMGGEGGCLQLSSDPCRTLWSSVNSQCRLRDKQQSFPLCHVLISSCIMCVQYVGGCSVRQGDTMSTSGGYHKYSRRGTMMDLGDIMIHVRVYYEYMRDVQYIGVVNINRRLLSIRSPT